MIGASVPGAPLGMWAGNGVRNEDILHAAYVAWRLAMDLQDISMFTWPAALPVPAPGALCSDWVPAVEPAFPGLMAALAATPQDPRYHAEGDVWTHTQMVVDALLHSTCYAASAVPARGVLFHAALLHDISKPETTREDQGRIIAPGHSAKGAIAARVALWEHGVPMPLREAVCRLIESHQLPFFAFRSRKGQHPEFLARWQSCDRRLDWLCALAEADMRGRFCADQAVVLEEIACFAELAEELGCLRTPYAFPDAATRLAYLQSQGERFPDAPVFVADPFEVVLLSGLPASGKSTWAAQQQVGPVVSYDQIREEEGLAHGEGTGTIVHAAVDQMRTYLRARQPFVVDATHLSRQMRQRTVDLVRAYGGQVHVHYFEAPRPQVLARNQARDSTLTNAKLLRMVSRWEVPGLEEVEHITWHLDVPARRPLPTSR